ncbi:conserved hypothetical protein [Perkinsus marinus ATCC 50983]|uniref:Reverse transcriptase domain-containing protein n=1 Tax=Perkinsus marinus (strain ATCC 50983 / TXsc) TaxID=423536 RepID=C5KE15_PERM5|nr:conserved hypothetical protein [Perkinsus marinus ATCC 50983]EER17278.1 conserved hypothetical protein [Perkinsus marinus ATCC 50983]|eukprot:XP_002785482.1 conserved hypothetical protein [Perkinsus marinus ATCC 50983]
MLGGKASKGVDLTGMDVDRFVEHFNELLGEQKVERNEEYEKRRGFRIAKELAEVEGEPWEVSIAAPDDEEIEKLCKRMRNGKAVGIDEIPSELFKHSEECRKVTLRHCHLAKVLGVVIRGFWRGQPLPEKSHTAVLITLFKGKGNRIKEAAEKRLMKYQFGFTSGKSCRDPVRLLWKKWESTNQIASVFVDFQEAFDSLSWEASWKVLKSLDASFLVI